MNMLKVKNLKKYFGGIKAVNGCNFIVKEKTITALIGPNGAGKSTVFNLISGINKADSGNIIFNKNNIVNLSPEKISNLGISRLFQHSSLFNNLTIEENLLLALDSEDTKFWKNFFISDKRLEDSKKIIDKKLEEMNMNKFKNRLSQDLSYGQKRLIELVRSILNPHQFLMLDEPVAGVNPKLRQKIAKILVKLKNQGETILLIEHDMEFTLKIADWVIVMDEGKVIAEDEATKIKNNKMVIKAYLG